MRQRFQVRFAVGGGRRALQGETGVLTGTSTCLPIALKIYRLMSSSTVNC